MHPRQRLKPGRLQALKNSDTAILMPFAAAGFITNNEYIPLYKLSNPGSRRLKDTDISSQQRGCFTKGWLEN